MTSNHPANSPEHRLADGLTESQLNCLGAIEEVLAISKIAKFYAEQEGPAADRVALIGALCAIARAAQCALKSHCETLEAVSDLLRTVAPRGQATSEIEEWRARSEKRQPEVPNP